MKLVLVITCLVLAAQGHQTGKPRPSVETLTQWNMLKYGFSSAAEEAQAVADGSYVQDNCIPIDVAAYYGNEDNRIPRIFVTSPRFRRGVPYSISTVSQSAGDKDGILHAYPNSQWHNSSAMGCDGITSAFRVAINECNQMWIIDSGLDVGQQRCPPQLLLFDLKNDQLIHRYRFNSSLYTPNVSMLVTPVVFTQDPPPLGNCQRSILYTADVNRFSVVVYDQENDSAWRTQSKYMYPDPNYGTHIIAGESFTLMDGIMGVSTDRHYLYFHPMASISEYRVPLRVLNNRTNFAGGANAQEQQFLRLGSRRSECAAEAIDSRGNQYCVTFNPIKLISWNVNTPYNSRYLHEIPADSKSLEFVSGMKVVKNIEGKEELWMMSNRYQRVVLGTKKADDVNFRILKLALE